MRLTTCFKASKSLSKASKERLEQGPGTEGSAFEGEKKKVRKAPSSSVVRSEHTKACMSASGSIRGLIMRAGSRRCSSGKLALNIDRLRVRIWRLREASRGFALQDMSHFMRIRINIVLIYIYDVI